MSNAWMVDDAPRARFPSRRPTPALAPHPADSRRGWPSLVVAGLVLAQVAAPLLGDPRVRLVELQLTDRDDEALAALEELAAQDAEAARRLGLDYLRGHLLLRGDQRSEALEAFALTMSATPVLASYSLYHLALDQEELGHPEVAGGLLVKLLGSGPPQSLAAPAMRRLATAIDDGADCRLLDDLVPSRFRRDERRLLLLARAECARRAGRAEAAAAYRDLLEERRGDDVALVAARRLAALDPEAQDPRTHFLLGLAFYEHREFPVAMEHLARTLVRIQSAPAITRTEIYELRYALARSYFWEGRYRSAAVAFGTLAQDTSKASLRAQALYQQGRSLELDGEWEAASAAYHQAARTDPRGGWADGALIADLRLHWRSGDEASATAAYEELIGQRYYGTASRALLFLAASDLVLDRHDRAKDWLGTVQQLGRVDRAELDYWRGRQAESARDLEKATAHYLDVLRDDAFQPFARAARSRLRGQVLSIVARRRAERLARSNDTGDLRDAWLLFEPSSAQRRTVESRLLARLADDASAAAFLQLRAEPPAAWPLWESSSLGRPEEMLLALGLFDEGSERILRHFPVSRPGLAFTGSLVLARSGDTRQSLYVAEILSKRVPRLLPPGLLPAAYRQLLYPLHFRDVIFARSEKSGIDPYLLVAVIREESRFDPQAFSSASARGLTQFVMPTARQVARDAGLGAIEPRDLEKPETSITLGATYLSQLSQRFGGQTEQIVAAYNAGEPQAEHWRRYCFSDEPEEYLTKIAFRETRAYVTKVLTSRAHYLELYPPDPP